MSLRVLTPRECVIRAIGKMILDFRVWLVPETKLLSRWKTQKYAYAVAEGRLVNDVQAMLDSLRKKEAEFPILVYAIQQIASPPDLSQVVGVPQELDVILPTDPLKRRVKLRTEPRAYHVQFAFLSNDTDSANAFTSQFCSYIRLMEKRRFGVEYYLSPDVTDRWHLTIFDNSIFPDSAQLDETNLVAGLLEFDFAGLVPRVIKGLPPLYAEEFGPGSNVGGDSYNPNSPIYGGTPGSGQGGGQGDAWGVVVEADMFKDRNEPEFKRLYADEATGERTEQMIKKQ